MAVNNEALFNPKGIVILGASSDPGKLGYAVARNLVEGGYPGEVHFVNPKGGILFGRPLHHSVLDVPDPVDLAVVIVPAQAAPQAIKDISRRGIHAVIVDLGGIPGEWGKRGSSRERNPCAVQGVRNPDDRSQLHRSVGYTSSSRYHLPATAFPPNRGISPLFLTPVLFVPPSSIGHAGRVSGFPVWLRWATRRI